MRRLRKNFMENIRSFNSAVAMASMGAQVDTLQGRGPYCYRIHGQIYHRLGPLHPREGELRQYGQIYILDTELAAQQRFGNARNAECSPELMRFLSELLSSVNVYAQSFKMMHELEQAEILLAAQENRTPLNIRMVFEESTERGLERWQYDLPTANEVAVISVGEDNDVPANRSLAVHLRGESGEQLINIRDIDKICGPLTYPLLFPTGAGGWDPSLTNTEGGRITQKDYYAYLFSIRDEFNPILYAGKLCQQFAVDAYVKIEQNRLNFQRRNQLILRRETFRGLQDYLAGDDDNGPPGSRVILSSSHQGSPRAMQQSYQDAMAIVARYGKPTYFLTMTCNPQWKELRENLFQGQSASDRPDLVARVFNAKLQELCTDLFKGHVLGEVEAYVYVIEFQKRGLPHCHMLLIMKNDWRVRRAEDVDRAICAEIPNRQTEPELYAAVTFYMIHRQCGTMDPRAPCMQRGSCSKRFPKLIRDRTSVEVDGYPNYRRRNLSPTEINGIPYEDEWVVPTNPYLILKYDCHINLEVCGMISAVKYLYKYIYKGPDRARISIEVEGNTDENENVDEIKQHLNTRYVCAPQSLYRIFGYPMQNKSHTVYSLAVHLPDFQTVHFVHGREEQYLEQAEQTFTTLTAYFELNRQCAQASGNFSSDFAIDARELFYYQLAEYFTFDRHSGWSPRKRGGKQIGRMYAVSPRDNERYCLRILLLNTKGKVSFEDIRTVNGITFDTFAEAAKQAGFLDDDRYFRLSLQEAAQHQSAAGIRSFFACLLCYCEVVQAQDLWNEFADAMSEDYMIQGLDRECAVATAYFDVLDKMALIGKDLREVVPPPVAERPEIPHVDVDYEENERTGLLRYESLNIRQKAAADDIIDALDRRQNRCIFIDGPGGSGKTYLYNTVYNIAIGRRRKVVCVAWTGIAANLLPGGRTVNSLFKLNIGDENRTSSMKRQQKEAIELMAVDMVIWDEISMTPIFKRAQNSEKVCITW
nr:Protein F59H6.5 [Haemonchus contortus]